MLLLGPLYHLPEREDRLQALREAHRVARRGAPVFAAGISRYATLMDLGSDGRLDAAVRAARIVERDPALIAASGHLLAVGIS